MTDAVVWSYVFDDIALPLANGAVGQQHIMRFLPLARCYRPIDELGHDYFKLQSYFLTHFLCVSSRRITSLRVSRRVAACLRFFHYTEYSRPAPLLLFSSRSFPAGRYVYSDWGRHELRADLFEEEFTFLLQNTRTVIRLADPELVGEFLHCLRIFGVGVDTRAAKAAASAHDDDIARAAAAEDGAAAGAERGATRATARAPPRPASKLPKWHAAAELWMDDGVSFLLNTERKFGLKGSWVSDGTAFYTRYHAAYCGIVGVLELGDATALPPRSARTEERAAVRAVEREAAREAEGAVPPQLCSYTVPRPFVVADMSTALAPPVSLERLVATMSG